MTQTFFYILSASILLLGFASLATFFLQKKNPKNSTLEKVRVIVKTWWWIVCFFLFTLGTAPWGLLAGFALISLVVAFEYYSFSKLEKLKNTLRVIICIFVIAQYALLGFGQFRCFQLLPILTVLLTLAPVVIFKSDLEQLPRTAASLIGPIVFFHFLACLPALFLLANKTFASLEKAQLLVFLIIFLTEINDISQFIFGKLFGKNKIIPHISPNKTEAGFIGGLFFTIAVASILFTKILQLPLWQSILFGVVISVYGIMGDLFFSAVKRHFGTKDFSNALPGHGGYLDRLDSLILTSPVVFYLFYFLIAE